MTAPNFAITKAERQQVEEQHKELRFTAPEVCALAGCTYRQLDHWIRYDHLASRLVGLGSGQSRRFTLAEVVEVATTRALIRAGFRVEAAARLASAHRRPHWETP